MHQGQIETRVRPQLGLQYGFAVLAWLHTMPNMPGHLVILMLLPVWTAQFGGPHVVSVDETTWSVPKAHAGDERVLAVVLQIADGYHINPDAAQLRNVGLVKPIESQLRVKDAAATLVFETPQYPEPHPVKVQYVKNEDVWCLEGSIKIFLPVKVSGATAPGNQPVQLAFRYQACTDTTCLPPKTLDFDVALTVVPPDKDVGQPNEALFEVYQEARDLVVFNVFGHQFKLDVSSTAGVAALLLVAALGGLLLNFTPCVLPVVPLKIMGLSQSAGNRLHCLLLGLAMSAGVVGFWLALGASVALVAGFTATNQLFQYPAFTIAVGIIIALMAVGMCGLFAIRLPQFVYRFSPKHDTVVGSFGFGIMTAVLSTPCTAPFMGGAAAWAATREPATTMTTFVAIGLGMAMPYLLLSAVPQWVNKLPRTGPGSELIKQVMGLLMLAAAAYFIGVGVSGWWVSPPDPPSKHYWWPVALAVAAAGCWLIYRTVRITPSSVKRGFWGALGLVIIVASVYGATRLTAPGPIDWVYYTPQRFDDAFHDGKVVVMDFTAEWCLNCKALEHGVLYADDVAARLNGPDVTPMKVDLTGNNELGREKLHSTGQLMIPLLLVYAPDGTEVFKGHTYTAGQVLAAIGEAEGGGDGSR